MKDILNFSVPGSSRIHDLKLGITLIRFIEFDLSFFKEQCISLYDKVQKNEKDLLTESQAVKEYIRNCHPYCSALIKTTFDKIAIDCVIEEICVKDGIGTEELWVKNMAGKTPSEKALFERITEYKVGSAINQWSNLRRMQKYAALKLSVLYGGEEKDYVMHKARKLYFDTAFSMTASKLGFSYNDLPDMKISSVPYLRMADSLMGNTMNILEPVVREMLGHELREPLRGKECMKDQAAGVVYNAIRGLRRPDVDDLRQVLQFYDAVPNLVFEPASFKAVIDLEFDYLLENGLYISSDQDGYLLEQYLVKSGGMRIEPDSECPSPDVPAVETQAPTKAEPTIDSADKKDFEPQKTDAYGSDGVQAEQTQKPEKDNAAIDDDGVVTDDDAIADDDAVDDGAVDDGTTADNAAVADNDAVDNDEPEPIYDRHLYTRSNELKISTHRVQKIIKLSGQMYRQSAKPHTLEEVNMHCYQLWTDMKTNSSFNVTPDEASEWFRYMTRVRQEIGKGIIQADSLDRFLDATYTVFNLSSPDQ